MGDNLQDSRGAGRFWGRDGCRGSDGSRGPDGCSGPGLFQGLICRAVLILTIGFACSYAGIHPQAYAQSSTQSNARSNAQPVSQAVPVDGRRDAGFRQAIIFYLSDNDAAAMPLLSDLAKKGNSAARLFLGRLDGHINSDYLAGLSRRERLALMRQKGGAFGKSWLTAIEDESELVRLLLAAKHPQSDWSVAARLAELGEPGEATRIYRRMADTGQWTPILQATKHNAVPPAATYLSWAAALSAVPSELTAGPLRQFTRAVAGQDTRAALALDQAHWGRYAYKPLVDWNNAMLPLTRGDVLDQHLLRGDSGPAGRNEMTAEVEKALATSPMTRHIAQFCARHCDGEVPACMRAVFFGVGGFRTLVQDVSPVEAILSQERYLQSYRRQVRLPRLMRKFLPRVFAKTSICVRDLMLAEKRKQAASR